MALKAVGNVVGCVWESNDSFRLSVDISAEAQSTTVLTDAFASDLSATEINVALTNFIIDYIMAEWSVSYDPSIDSVRIIKSVSDVGAASIALSSKTTVFWELDEDTGTPRADSVGSNDFTEAGTVAREATSDDSFAAVFDGDPANHLVVENSPELVSGEFDFTISFWMKQSAPPPTAGYICASADSTDNMVFGVKALVGVQQIVFWVGVESFAPTFEVATEVWVFIAIRYDAATRTASLSMNALPAETYVFTGDPIASDSVKLYIGTDNPTGEAYTGLLRRFDYAPSILSDADLATKYNYGQGQDWPFADAFLAAAPPVVPTGTGFVHITDGAQDEEAQLVTNADIEELGVGIDKLALMPGLTIIANNEGGEDYAKHLTISQVLDMVPPTGDGTILIRESGAWVASDIIPLSVAFLVVPADDGDMIVRIGSVWTVVHKGTPGQVLTMNAGGTAPEWQTP